MTHHTRCLTMPAAFFAAVLTLATLPGCETTGSQARQREAELAAQAAALNTTCPITAGPVDTEIISTHRGQRVAFASAAAQQQWNEMDDEQRDVALARVFRR